MKKTLKCRLIEYKIELIIFSLFLLYLILFRIISPVMYLDYSKYNDFTCYAKMANDITCIFRHEIVEPYIHRVFVPFIAGILPFDLETNFTLIGFISIYLTGLMLFSTLRINFNKTLSVIGLLFFFQLIWFNRINLFYFVYLVDTTAYLFFICCFYCILKEKRKSYVFFLTLGILTKECLLLTIPVFITYQLIRELENKKLRVHCMTFLRSFVYITPGLIIFFSLRIASVPDMISNHPFWYNLYGQNEYGTIDMVLALIQLRFNDFSNVFDYTIGIWGILFFFLTFLRKEQIINGIKLYGIFILLVYSQLFLARGYIRFLFVGFYPMIYLSLLGFQNIKENLLLVPPIVFQNQIFNNYYNQFI